MRTMRLSNSLVLVDNLVLMHREDRTIELCFTNGSTLSNEYETVKLAEERFEKIAKDWEHMK